MQGLHLQERRQLRLFLRRDDYGRFVSALVYVPRDRYTTTVRRRIGRYAQYYQDGTDAWRYEKALG